VILLQQPIGHQAAVRQARELIMGRRFLQGLVQIGEHRLIAIGNADRLLELADLLVVATAQMAHLLTCAALITVGDRRDALKPGELLPHPLDHRLKQITQRMTVVAIVAEKLGDAHIQGVVG
jgi:hypothetical protein